jgi:hypothetical protein
MAFGGIYDDSKRYLKHLMHESVSSVIIVHHSNPSGPYRYNGVLWEAIEGLSPMQET